MKQVLFKKNLLRGILPLKWLFLFALSGLVLSSCLKDETGWGTYYVNYGIIQGTSSNFSIVTDEGEVLHVVENKDPGFEIADGKRVVVNYSVLATNEDSKDVRINELVDLLTKLPVLSSSLSSTQQDSIGFNPIEVTDVWFGGAKYLNINFMVYRANANIKHFINLVVNENESTIDRKVVQLRHNAYDDPWVTQSYGRVSFDVSSLLPAGMDSIKLVLKWHTYGDDIKCDSGYYKPGFQAVGFQISEGMFLSKERIR